MPQEMFWPQLLLGLWPHSRLPQEGATQLTHWLLWHCCVPGVQVPQELMRCPQLLAALWPQVLVPHEGATQSTHWLFWHCWVPVVHVPQGMVWPQLLGGLLPQVLVPQEGATQSTHWLFWHCCVPVVHMPQDRVWPHTLVAEVPQVRPVQSGNGQSVQTPALQNSPATQVLGQLGSPHSGQVVHTPPAAQYALDAQVPHAMVCPHALGGDCPQFWPGEH